MNLARERAFLVAELQGGQAAGMQCNVGVDGVGVQTLTEHQDSLLMLVPRLIQEGDVGGQRYVAGHFLPGELKRVRGQPHVLAAAGDGVGFLRSVVINGAWVQDGADVGLAFEDADGRTGILSVTASTKERTTANEQCKERQRSAHEVPPSTTEI